MANGSDRPDGPASAASPMSRAAALSTEDEAVVAAFGSVLEAELARGRLEADGIFSRVVDGNTAGMAPLALALGGVRLVVAQGDFEAARAILFSPSALVEEDREEDVEGNRLDPTPESEEGKLARRDLGPDDLANRALRASILGLVLVPPVGHLWSLFLLGSDVWPRRRELGRKGKRDAAIALMIDAAAVAGSAFVVWSVVA